MINIEKYEQLIIKAQSETRYKGDGEYYEAHHILPSCWCVGDLEYLKKEEFLDHYNFEHDGQSLSLERSLESFKTLGLLELRRL